MVKLSIVIPYYKTYDLTCELLEVLIPQLNNEVEVFLVDDGCHEERLDKYKGINIIHLDENAGATIAMNTAFKQAVGKYNAIIDSDDMITNDYIEILLKAIDEHNEDVILFDWMVRSTKQIVHRPNNYAPWKAIYKKEIMPRFRDGWKYSYDVPFQEDLEKTNYTRCYLDKMLYIYYDRRPGNLTLEKEAIIRGKK